MGKRPFRKLHSVEYLCGLLLCAWLLSGGTAGDAAREPQAILVLGGSPIREQFAARFAQQHPTLPIWVSSGSPRDYAQYVFDRAGIPRHRVTLDYRAVDTVTNFTTLVDAFRARRIQDVYLITSDYHMPRAQAIGSIVFGSRGIRLHPVPIPSSAATESSLKVMRDGLRSAFWLVTGTALSVTDVNNFTP